jgi:hypothetical protein
MAELVEDRTLLPADEQQHEAQHRRQVLEKLRGCSSGEHPRKLTEWRGLFSRQSPGRRARRIFVYNATMRVTTEGIPDEAENAN